MDKWPKTIINSRMTLLDPLEAGDCYTGYDFLSLQINVMYAVSPVFDANTFPVSGNFLWLAAQLIQTCQLPFSYNKLYS